MKRPKNRISGYYKTPNIVEILKRYDPKLVPGQKVLVYTDTDQEIKSASGEVIGHKQNVLGDGRVKKANDRLVVEINPNSSSKSYPKMPQARLNNSVRRGFSPSPHALRKAKVRPLGIATLKPVQLKSKPICKVFIKPIDE